MARTEAAVSRAVPLQAACRDRGLIPLLPHPAQAEFLALIEEHAIVFAACGRRFGKSKAVAAAALHNLLLNPEADRLVSRDALRARRLEQP